VLKAFDKCFGSDWQQGLVEGNLVLSPTSFGGGRSVGAGGVDCLLVECLLESEGGRSVFWVWVGGARSVFWIWAGVSFVFGSEGVGVSFGRFRSVFLVGGGGVGRGDSISECLLAPVISSGGGRRGPGGTPPYFFYFLFFPFKSFMFALMEGPLGGCRSDLYYFLRFFFLLL